MDRNPLFDVDVSDADSSSHSSIDGESYTAAAAPSITTPTVAVLQTINIKSHVPIELDLTESNYTGWCCLFDAFVGKFGLSDHLSSPPTTENRRDPAWIMRDLGYTILSPKMFVPSSAFPEPRRTRSGTRSRFSFVTMSCIVLSILRRSFAI
jgi:hypothetical protein